MTFPHATLATAFADLSIIHQLFTPLSSPAEYAPDQFDKSGYLFLLPKRDGKKTLGRRLSMKKKKPTRYW